MLNTLLIEDSIIECKLMTKMLENYCNVTAVHCGLDGLREYYKSLEEGGTKYDVILLDINMPNMNGDEVLKHIQVHEDVLERFHARVIMVTANGDKATVMKLFALGCEEYIVKPINKEQLIKAILK